MRDRPVILSMMLATALLVCACHGQLVIGGREPPDSGPSSSGGGVTVVEPDGGTLVIPPQKLVVQKVDLLFMIDNSASMGDKQAYLEQAIPDLVTRFVTPNCLDDTDPTKILGPSTLKPDGSADCTGYPKSHAEFPPVHDMHIGIVSSSLGPRLGDKQPSDGTGGVCPDNAPITINGATLDRHGDDKAHLLTRSSDPALPVTAPPTEVPLADGAATPGFLTWYPPSNTGAPGNVPVTTAAQLQTDFADLIAGVRQYGCGIESQLESWYRFLIQPDPYASLALVNSKATWVGVDTTILKQRHDFLRPDSLVVVVDLTDENDSEIDVRSIGGQGYLFMSTKFDPPHGTPECTTNPDDPACTTQGTVDRTPYSSPLDWGYDLNLRHVHTKAKYGLDPQFPIGRYQTGLLSPNVPDRAGEYPSGAANYVGDNNCTNPLYAASLPDGTGLSPNAAANLTAADAAALCNLPRGPRTAGLVYFLHIGGVPPTLLHYSPVSAVAASELTDADWVKILGKDPLHYDYAGIDPHMIESYQPRPGLPTTPGADPISGNEWVTNVGAHLDLNVDREYACIFKLATPRDCSKKADGTYNVPGNGFSCDCSSTGLTPDQLSPVCNPANSNEQIAAKAYPTIRELTLAKLLGPQGLVASICPVNVADNATGTDPLYGYRPAVSHLIDHVRPTLAFAGK